MFEIIPFASRNSMFKMFDEFEKELRNSQPSRGGFRTDVSDNGDSYLLEAELPGFNKEDISVDIADGILTVSAQHTEETEDNQKNYVYRERSFGSYSRSFDLSGIDESAISGEYNNGILELTLPKIKEIKSQTRKIELS